MRGNKIQNTINPSENSNKQRVALPQGDLEVPPDDTVEVQRGKELNQQRHTETNAEGAATKKNMKEDKEEENKVDRRKRKRKRKSHRSRFLFPLAQIFSRSPLKLSSQSLLFCLCFSSFHVSPPHFLRLADPLAATKTIASVSLFFSFFFLSSNGVNQQNSKSYPQPEAIKLSK